MDLVLPSTFRNSGDYDVSRELEVQLHLRAAVAQFEKLTNRSWAYAEDAIEVHDTSTCGRTLFLRRYPVEDVALVEVANAGEEFVTLAASEYVVRSCGELSKASGKWKEYEKVRVTVTGGYFDGAEDAEFETPADIKLAIAVQARFLMARVSADNIAVRSQNFEGGQGSLLSADFHPLFKSAVQNQMRRT